MNCLRSLEYWGRAFEAHSRHGCLSSFILCVGSDLATGWSPVQESYRLCIAVVLNLCETAAWYNWCQCPEVEKRWCIGLRNRNSDQGPKGCRAIEKERKGFILFESIQFNNLFYNKLDLRLSQRWLSRVLSSAMRCHVVQWKSAVSDESITSIFKVEDKTSRQRDLRFSR
jgi:hypothetical protein